MCKPQFMESLDKQFKSAFESKDFTVAIRLLKKGATATLLEHDEWGYYNLPMLINDMGIMLDKDEMDTAAALVRLAIQSGTDLDNQKAYFWNRGTPAIYIVCYYLAKGLTELNTDQYRVFYELFPLVAAHTTHDAFEVFLSYLERSPEVLGMQDQLIVQMMEMGWKLTGDPGRFFFIGLLKKDIIFRLDYSSLDAGGMQQLLNTFTSDKQARKLFRIRASKGLMQSIMDIVPDVVYQLIKRNEQDMLIPFLKHFKKEITAQPVQLRAAVSSRKVVENTILLLKQAGLAL